MHEDIICASSDFFKKAINGPWKESNERLISLSHEEPDIFAIYLNWLYRGTLPTRIDEPGLIGNEEYLKLAKAYGLADRLLDQAFKNAVMDAFIDKTSSKTSDGHRWYPVGSVIRCIYENTPESSKGRTLLVDIYAENARKDWLTDWATREDLPKQFLLDLILRLFDISSGDDSRGNFKLTRCNYHDHDNGKSCEG